MRIANKIVFLKDGVVVYEGNPKDAPESEVESVRQFFAASH
jgi:ABC-type transporter Mla maintaining outer membrane lipid asymmetry ATPase subunit MlaF